MGGCNSNASGDITRKDAAGSYNFDKMVGWGGHGEIYRVVHKQTKEEYAIKVQKKCNILTKKTLKQVLNERSILKYAYNPFIVNMKQSFQDFDNLYLVLDYMGGGDLRYHLNKGIEFNEEQTKFIAACIIIAISKLHDQNVIHRDVKPENLVFDKNGYLRLTDFGIARYNQNLNTKSKENISGTLGYMALEVLMKQPHGHTVDYYSLGVILYEIIYGERPYMGKNRDEFKTKILKDQKRLKKSDLPDKTWNKQCADFVSRLIQRNPASRLGFGGVEEVLSHPWMQGMDWTKIYQKQLKAPFIPKVDEGDTGGNIQYKPNNQEIEKDKKNQMLLKRDSIQEQFARYTYDPSQSKERNQKIDPKNKDCILQSPTKPQKNNNNQDHFYLRQEQEKPSFLIQENSNYLQQNQQQQQQLQENDDLEYIQALQQAEQLEKQKQNSNNNDDDNLSRVQRRNRQMENMEYSQVSQMRENSPDDII